MCRDRPVAKAKTSTDAVEVQVELKNPVVEARTDALENAIEIHEAVELVAVHHQKSPAIHGFMNCAFHQPDAAEIESHEILKELVMIPIDISDLGFLPVHSKEFLDHRVGIGVPEPATLQLPAVNDVADEIEMAALRLVKEVEKQLGLRVAASQVDIGNPNGVVFHPVDGTLGWRLLSG